ncbi:MAG: DUF6198 family protein [Methanobrevibacter sp.]|uniref:DUF6198 family protein n=1 Tax=Methanobrevibacter sp. TaxID=66852 RepID=UPI0026DEB2A1|nr:DUF6198 family protein [Methanobrevibacter sp.]MDO5848496.1 DUF6198 family protein [Methanobrevibacter sp.]
MTIGVAFSFKSNLGSSPISSIPYSISLIWGIDVGTATIGFHIILVFIEFLLLRKDFQAKFLLQIVAGVIFGWFTNIAVYLVGFIPDFGIVGSFVFLAISIVIVAFGIFLYLPPDIVQLAGEGVMQAVAIVSNQPFPKVKVLFDSSMVVISFLMCGFFIGNFFASVGIGTVLAAILIGTTLKYIVKGFKLLTGRTVDLKQM